MTSMADFEIKIQTSKLKHYSKSLVNSIDPKTLSVVIEGFSRYVQRVYIVEIRRAMRKSNRYRGQWEPVDDPGYVEFLGTSPTNQMYDYLPLIFETVKVGPNWIIRVSDSYVYPNTSLKILKVLRSIEHGTTKFRARPLINKVASEVEHSILALWRYYLYSQGVLS